MFKPERCNGGDEVVKKPPSIAHLKPIRPKIPNKLGKEKKAKVVKEAANSLRRMTKVFNICKEKIKGELKQARNHKYNAGMHGGLSFEFIELGNQHERTAWRTAALWAKVHTLTYEEMTEQRSAIHAEIAVEEAARLGAPVL
jgi:hypothetical protein